jgi:hypothetical protein
VAPLARDAAPRRCSELGAARPARPHVLVAALAHEPAIQRAESAVSGRSTRVVADDARSLVISATKSKP